MIEIHKVINLNMIRLLISANFMIITYLDIITYTNGVPYANIIHHQNRPLCRRLALIPVGTGLC